MVAIPQHNYGVLQWAGRPLWSTLALIGLPIVVVIGISAAMGGQIPKGALYGVAAALGIVLVISTVRNVEWLLAAVVLYLPLSKLMPAVVAPGLNGVNILMLLILLAWAVALQRKQCSIIKGVPYGRVMLWYALFSIVSVFTIMQDPLGKEYFLAEGVTEFKGWLDQFILFFGFANLIKGGAMARRIIIYCVIGSVIAECLGILEMLSKQGLSSIEKSRVNGPPLQPNNFGAFIVYNLSPIIAFFVLNFRKWYAWLAVPYVLISLKLLLATFSRGAYIGLALASGSAVFFRGLVFTAIMAVLGILAAVNFPQLIPDALRDRMSSTTSGYNSVTLDSSANTRLILWEAGLEMTVESPVFGKGFMGFSMLKSQYTDVPVFEGDPHNMYLYLSSEMGIPALLLFLLLLYGFFRCALRVYRTADDNSSRVIGLGGLTMVAGVVAINMFGTRMVNSDVSGYFWIYFAVLIALLRERDQRDRERERPAKTVDESATTLQVGKTGRQHRPDKSRTQSSMATSLRERGRLHRERR